MTQSAEVIDLTVLWCCITANVAGFNKTVDFSSSPRFICQSLEDIRDVKFSFPQSELKKVFCRKAYWYIIFEMCLWAVFFTTIYTTMYRNSHGYHLYNICSLYLSYIMSKAAVVCAWCVTQTLANLQYTNRQHKIPHSHNKYNKYLYQDHDIVDTFANIKVSYIQTKWLRNNLLLYL